MKASFLTRIALAAALALAVLAAPPARAAEPSVAAVAAAKQLINQKSANLFDPLIPGVIESVKNAFAPTNPNLLRELNEVAAQLRKDLAAKKDDVLDAVARVYAQHFSEQELNDMLAFYKTPLGRKMLADEPLAVEASLKRAQNWANEFSEEVMRKFREEMRKKGHEL
jgi:hypothetical protein